LSYAHLWRADIIRIREVNDYSDFVSLADSWNTFLADSNHSVFTSWTWLSTWWKHFGNGRKLAVLIAEENNEFIGIAPLMYSVESIFGLRRGKFEFIGMPDSDYNSFVVKRENVKNEKIFNLFLKYLNGIPEKWDYLNLKDIPENSEFIPFLKRTSNLKHLTKCFYFLLPESYEVFLKSLSYKQRGSVNNTMNKIKKNFSADLVDYSSSSECVEGLRLLIELNQKRWAAVGLCGAFPDDRIRDFHFDIAQSFAKKDMLGLYILKFDGKPVSGSYGFKYNSKYYAYLNGFDPEYSKFGVGSVLVPYLVDEFVKKGLTEFDFLRGNENYKVRWNGIPRWNFQAVLGRSGVLGGIQHRLTEEVFREGARARWMTGEVWKEGQAVICHLSKEGQSVKYHLSKKGHAGYMDKLIDRYDDLWEM
jgi:CelD/BcsL family acetyltransferase involved in cellulose biosynthesis